MRLKCISITLAIIALLLFATTTFAQQAIPERYRTPAAEVVSSICLEGFELVGSECLPTLPSLTPQERVRQQRIQERQERRAQKRSIRTRARAARRKIKEERIKEQQKELKDGLRLRIEAQGGISFGSGLFEQPKGRFFLVAGGRLTVAYSFLGLLEFGIFGRATSIEIQNSRDGAYDFGVTGRIKIPIFGLRRIIEPFVDGSIGISFIPTLVDGMMNYWEFGGGALFFFGNVGIGPRASYTRRESDEGTHIDISVGINLTLKFD